MTYFHGVMNEVFAQNSRREYMFIAPDGMFFPILKGLYVLYNVLTMNFLHTILSGLGQRSGITAINIESFQDSAYCVTVTMINTVDTPASPSIESPSFESIFPLNDDPCAPPRLPLAD